MQTDLRGVKLAQINHKQSIVSALQSNGRPANTPLICSEWNPSGSSVATGYAFNNSMAQPWASRRRSFRLPSWVSPRPCTIVYP